ncbi:FAD-dependent tricarballylate dehydrogenase TcuA [Microbacterium elymi]|uniref:FAD-dependent tricarballylate dehydrogenase TcuA n=1 Tax=Microbacterium elymi TaxID=2909587 RepID=A0ABY5NHN6_9MICO|nr:FAD-dependent tricarballylate dehydrogenase TcuA [Microbacterium elymi]UUT34675.1 FAD-dependent tricarballylate dehydrogenase TcuA [Microbacterium elymi]
MPQAERGRRVLLLERGAFGMHGGNSFYTAGATRIAHGGLDDLLDIVQPDERHERTIVPAYSAEEYAADLERVTEGRNDPALTEVLVRESAATVRWLHGFGVKYRLMYERQSYAKPDGSYLFWGGLHVGNLGGGEGLITDHTHVARELGAEVRYGVDADELLVEDGHVIGVAATTVDGDRIRLRAKSVVLAAGGFEADPEMRRRHLGHGWENAVVRGTPYNTGKMIRAALAIGASRGGDWSTAHSVQWDAEAADNASNRILTNRLTRQSYPLGIIVNQNGRRFLDEGADFRNYTYAKYGKVILEQPGSIAYQIFDARLRPMLRPEEYDMPGIGVHKAGSIADLARSIGVDAAALSATVDAFNAGIDAGAAFDPTVKDGRRANVDPVKSNWASALQTAPFYAYPVTCGITFTFGGLKSDTEGRALSADGTPIPGLLVCGEMLGGLFSGNYPGGSGLAAGMVFGRRAGAIA